MKNTSPKQKGILSELTAVAHFVKNKDNMVFLPLMGLGFIDILVLNKKTGEISFYDVKFGSRRKTSWISKSKVKARCLKGQLIYYRILLKNNLVAFFFFFSVSLLKIIFPFSST